jgi:hypothetical protein
MILFPLSKVLLIFVECSVCFVALLRRTLLQRCFDEARAGADRNSISLKEEPNYKETGNRALDAYANRA